jgi:hypothetical protein
MVRIGLAIYLMIATLAGPALCCCATQPPATCPTSTVAAPPADQHKSCCKHQHPAPKGGASQHKPQKDPGCPCKNNSSRSSAASPFDSNQGLRVALTGVAGDWLDAWMLLPPNVDVRAALALVAFRNTPVFPVPSSTDILRALHILRC